MSTNRQTASLSRQAIWSLLIVSILLGAGLRIFHLDSGLWYDEIKTLIESVRPSFTEIVTHFPGNNDHVLYSVLAHLSIVGWGEHAWSLRLPAVIFGIAAIPMLYLFGTTVTGRLEALSAASLLAVSYHHIWFSQNARGYTALLFWTLLGSYLLVIGLKDKRLSVSVGYAVISALGVYTHLTMVFVVITHLAVAAWHVLQENRNNIHLSEWKNPALGFMLAGLFSLLLYAPIFFEVQSSFGQETQPETVATLSWAFVEALRGLRVGFAMGWGVIFAGILFLSGCWSYFRQSPAILALFLLPAPITLAAAIVLERPIRPRFFFFLMGFGLLIAVRGSMAIGGWISSYRRSSSPGRSQHVLLPQLLIAGMMVLSVLALPNTYRYPKQDFEQALRFVEETRKDDEAVVVVGEGAAFPYQLYYLRPWPRIDSVEQLKAARATGDAVWLLYTFQSYIESSQPALMDAILSGCSPARTFPGTLAGGSIEVYRCDSS